MLARDKTEIKPLHSNVSSRMHVWMNLDCSLLARHAFYARQGLVRYVQRLLSAGPPSGRGHLSSLALCDKFNKNPTQLLFVIHVHPVV